MFLQLVIFIFQIFTKILVIPSCLRHLSTLPQPCIKTTLSQWEAPKPSDLLYLDFYLGSQHYFRPLLSLPLLTTYLYLKSAVSSRLHPSFDTDIFDLSALLNVISQPLLEILSSPVLLLLSLTFSLFNAASFSSL